MCAVVVVDVCPFCLFPVFRFVKTVVLHAAILLGMHLIMQCLVATLLQQALRGARRAGVVLLEKNDVWLQHCVGFQRA